MGSGLREQPRGPLDHVASLSHTPPPPPLMQAGLYPRSRAASPGLGRDLNPGSRVPSGQHSLQSLPGWPWATNLTPLGFSLSVVK